MDSNNTYREGLNPFLCTIVIIHIALGMGVLIFTAVVAGLSVGAQPASDPEMSLHEIMGYTAAALALIATALSCVLFPIFIENNKQSFTDVLAHRYQIFQSAHIMRMAILEGAALFGLIALLLYVQNVGPLNPSMEVILPALPVAIFIGLWISLFPTEDKIQAAIGNP